MSYEIVKNGQALATTYDSLTSARSKMREMYNELDHKYHGTPRFIGSNSAAIVCPYGMVHLEIFSF
jgi:hypothetical protein